MKRWTACPTAKRRFCRVRFWLADNYAFQGRHAEAREIFERVLAIRNDLGLLSEEYDPVDRRLLGNFPQAFSHVGLVNTAYNLEINSTSDPSSTTSPGSHIKSK